MATHEDGPGSVGRDRLLVIGEALIDIVHDRAGGTREHVGGSPANVALGLGRLGRQVSLLTQIGRDDHGRMIEQHLASSGVEILAGSYTDGPTSTASAALAEDGSAQYTFDIDWSLPASELPFEPLAVHTGSIAALLPPGAGTVGALLERQRSAATVSFDPNVRPALLGSAADARAEVEDRIALSDVVKASDEDLAWLYPGEEVTDVAAGWLDRGPSVVAVTLGGSGSVGVARSGVVRLESVAVTVVDTVGAGDAFMSGLLDGLWARDLLGAEKRPELEQIDGAALTWCLRRAALIAAVTVSRAGAQPPTSHDLEAWSADRLPAGWG